MRKIWMTVFCSALILFFTEAYGAAKTAMQTALHQSQWSGCTLLAEDRDGDLCAGIAVNPATGRKIFVIAQRKDGVFAVTACYENAIPPEWDASSMQVKSRHPMGNQGAGQWMKRLFHAAKTNLKMIIAPCPRSPRSAA